jgi:hypothetical protein
LGVGRGANNSTQEKINVKNPEAMRAGRNQLRRYMAGHSKGGQGLKRAVVAQKKEKRKKKKEK